MKKIMIAAALCSAAAFALAPTCGAVPWPYQPTNQEHRIGTNYGEFQRFGTAAPYMHDALDLVSTSGPRDVYSVSAGRVMSVNLNPGNSGVVIGDPAANGLGWQYWFLAPSTIQVQVGQNVVVGQYLGRNYGWHDDLYFFHFARVRGANQPNWTTYSTVDNPLPLLTPHGDATTPIVEDTYDGKAFAFADNATHELLDPYGLSGQVDIVTRIKDVVGPGSYPLSPWKVEYSIDGGPASIPWTDFVTFSGPLPSGAGDVTDIYRTEDPLASLGDYVDRVFYFVPTNKDANGYSAAPAWNTASFGPGDYWVNVRATDAGGNVSTRSMLCAVEGPLDLVVQTELTPHEFDCTPVDWNVSEIQTVFNNGSSWASVRDISFSDPAFWAEEQHFFVPPHGNHSFAVYFHPTGEQAYSGTMTIRHNDVGHPDYVVPLSGRGYRQEIVCPQGGDVLATDQAFTIEWTGDGCGAQYAHLELYRNGQWTTITSTVPFSRHYYEWTPTGAAASDARLRLSAIGGGPGSQPDESGTFALVNLSAEAPTGLTITRMEDRRRISWTPHSQHAVRYDILYRCSMSQQWNVLDSTTNDHTWDYMGCNSPCMLSAFVKVAAVLEIGCDELVPIRAEGLTEVEMPPCSGACTSLNINRIAPNDVWSIATMAEVWIDQPAPSCGLIHVMLSRDGGQTYSQEIGQILAPNNFMTWQVDGSPSEDCWIGISGPGPSDVFGPFAIRPYDGGCPYLYTETDGAELVENTLMRQVPRMEGGRDASDQIDRYLLEHAGNQAAGEMQLVIKEFENERSWIDRVGLEAIRHPAGTRLALAPDGRMIAYDQAAAPLAVTDARGQDVLREVGAEDDVLYEGSPGSVLHVEFDRAGNHPTMFGIRVRQKEPGEGGGGGGGGRPGLPVTSKGIDVYLETGGAEGAFLGNVSPREDLSWRTISLPAPPAGTGDDGGKVKLRLEWRTRHGLDTVGLIVPSDGGVATYPMEMVRAEHSADGDSRALIGGSDGNAQTLSPGDALELTFKSPSDVKESKDHVWSYCFAIEGHYVHLDPVAGAPVETDKVQSTFPVGLSIRYPDRSDASAMFDVGLTRTGHATITIYSAAGTRVRTLVDQDLAAGDHTFTWDGRNQSGEKVGPGIYFTRLESDHLDQIQKVLLIR